MVKKSELEKIIAVGREDKEEYFVVKLKVKEWDLIGVCGGV